MLKHKISCVFTDDRRMWPAADALMFGHMTEARSQFVHLPLGRVETITQRQHHVGVRLVAFRLMLRHDWLLTGNSDLDAHMKKFGTRRSPCWRFDDDASVCYSIEM